MSQQHCTNIVIQTRPTNPSSTCAPLVSESRLQTLVNLAPTSRLVDAADLAYPGEVNKPGRHQQVDELHQARKVNTNLLAWVVGILLIIAGISLVAVGEIPAVKVTAWSAVSANLGAAIAIAGVINVVWETRARRSLAAEVASMIDLRDQVKKAGMAGFTMEYLREVDWHAFLTTAKRVDIVSARGNSWRRANMAAIRALLKRRGSVVNVYLPDPDDEVLMTHLATRFQEDVVNVVNGIRDAVREWREISDAARGRVNILFHSQEPVVTIYRMDERVVMTLYSHGRGRRGVPVFIAEDPGELHAFAIEEIDFLHAVSAAKEA